MLRNAQAGTVVPEGIVLENLENHHIISGNNKQMNK